MEPRHDPLSDALRCDDAHELISAEADDELRSADRLRLAAHLDGCRECEAYADRVARLTRQVRLRRVAELAPRLLDTRGRTRSAAVERL